MADFLLNRGVCDEVNSSDAARERLRVGREAGSVVSRGHGTWYEKTTRENVFWCTQDPNSTSDSDRRIRAVNDIQISCMLLNQVYFRDNLDTLPAIPATMGNKLLNLIRWDVCLSEFQGGVVSGGAGLGAPYFLVRIVSGGINSPPESGYSVGTDETSLSSIVGSNYKSVAQITTGAKIGRSNATNIRLHVFDFFHLRTTNPNRFPYTALFRVEPAGTCILTPGTGVYIATQTNDLDGSLVINSPAGVSTIIWEEIDL